MYRYSFVSTQRDLLDSYEAWQSETSGMRPSIRLGLILLGLIFASASVAGALGLFENTSRLQILVWGAVGGSILASFVVGPALKRSSIKSLVPTEQPLVVEFNEHGIRSDVEGVGSFERPWVELARILPARLGVALDFVTGDVHWLPNRVFSDEMEKLKLLDYLVGRMEKPPLGSAPEATP